MKESLRFILIFLLCPICLFSQITTPIVKANFGVDADVRANFFNGGISASGDDWFIMGPGTGLNVIDTNGAAAKIAGYLTDISPWPRRMASFYRTMSKPQFSNVNHGSGLTPCMYGITMATILLSLPRGPVKME